jgi:outer membrane receptor protein involved in Fe transport
MFRLFITQQSLTKLKLSLTILVALLIIQTEMFSQQTGSIFGKITDKSNNEELIGANVLVLGTAFGSSSDIDGKFNIGGLSEGNYTIKISYISYNSVTVENIFVKAGNSTKVDVSLESTATELQEVLVTAEALRNSETSVLKIQKNSANIVDGFSGDLIKKNNSSDGTDILKRMSGVTISEGKYAFVRGVGDRYNNTLLNGANLPSTDPEKKSFSYDIFPANLIESIITAKTFTPDKPADFSGGLVQISTIEFPNKFTSEVSLSSGFNTQTSFKDFASYSGGKTDYLGIDDGTRDYPDLIGSEKVTRGNYSDQKLEDITSAFSNNWNLNSKKAPVNGGFKITAGDKFDLSAQDIFGYIGSFSYSNSFTTTEKQKNFYDFSGPRYLYKGMNYSSNVMWSGMLNLSYKFGLTNKLSLKNLYNQNADDESIVYKGDYRYADQYREITSLRFVSRSLFSSQLIGEHQFDFVNGLNLDWTFSYSRSDRNEPDARRYVYSRSIEEPNDPVRFQLDQSLATRYYGDLVDNDYNGGINLNFKLFENPNLPKLKVGALYNKKDRVFDARTFGFRNLPGGSFTEEDSVLQLSVQNIFQPENVSSTFIGINEITKASDSYGSNQKVAAGYFMFDTNILEQFRFVAGARFEYSNQVLNSFSQTGETISVNNIYRDWLPSLNLTYLLNLDINVRLAYSNTLARPEFRELAPFSYFDFIQSELVQGNPNLKRTIVKNYDIRFEYFPQGGELIALSVFYKRFNDPIEEILTASSSNEPIRSYANAISADNYGIEMEVRKSLGFISESVNKFSFVGNITLINSTIKINSEANGFQQNERPLQGQADYIFNLGLYYDDFDFGLNSSLVYNKVGSRIAKVGTNDLGNIIEKPIDIIDFSISKNLFESLALKLSVKDLLNQEKNFIQQAPGGDRISESNKTGRNISLELSYQIN